MNSNKKRLVIAVLLIPIIGIVSLGLALAKISPRFDDSKISSILIGKNWTTAADYIRISGSDFSCQPDDGVQWACEVVLEGKLLGMTVSYSLTPLQSLTGCTVIYDAKPVACDYTLSYGWNAAVMVKDDLGISPQRMAEIRAANPILYMTESMWIALGVAAAAILSFTVILLLLTLFNKKRAVMLPILRLPLPIWVVCLFAMLLTVGLNGLTGVMFVCIFGLVGTLLLSVVAVWLNNLDRKQGLVLAHVLKWAVASIIVFWLTNLSVFFGLLTLGYVD